MNYFNRNLPSEHSLNNSLNSIENVIAKFYLNNNNEDNFIRLHSSTLGKDEFMAFSKAYLEGNITLGKYNKQYEELARDRFSSNYCVTSNSGSSANLLAISALVQSGKLSPGDKVIVPVLAWSTTIFPLVQYGLIPVYVDISSIDFNLNTIEVQACLREHNIKAIMLIHTYGNPADLEFFINFCDSNSILLIEDTCESMGATWSNNPIGSFGVMGTFSSYYSHHICTFEGGLTLCTDKFLSDMMISIRSHGWTRGIDFDLSKEKGIEKIDPTFLFLNTGYNLRLSDPQAAIGCIQLSKLDSFISRRCIAANRFISNISNSSTLSKHIKYPKSHKKANSSWFGFPVLFPNLPSASVSSIRKFLLDSKVESRPFLAGDFSLQPVSRKFKHIYFNSCPNISLFHTNSFALPCHQDISLDNVDKMCSLIEKAINSI
tara:strand:+ start:381 stop:1676 length:1296 start_codon:yes stop_codon:yes gene_type:complete